MKELERTVCNALNSLRPVCEEGECELFGRQVGATLQRLNPHQRALAKLWIQHILLDIEFPRLNEYKGHMTPY